jgi:prepilin signal peptidase PulO-like enzyme (type II secretory pathway)
MASEQRRTTLEQFGVDHIHTPAATVGIVIFSVILGAYAGWITADFGLRVPVFVLVTIVVIAWLYRQRDGWEALTTGLYLLAALVVLTPILFDLAFVLDARRYDISNVSGFVLTLSDLVFFLVFVLIALISAGLATLIRRWR